MTDARPDAMAKAEALAAAMDAGDWPAARALLSPDCEYVCRGERTTGPEEIVASYRSIHEWVTSTFERVAYQSRVEAVSPERAAIHYRDQIDHGEHHLDFRCRQHLTVDGHGRICRIEHEDLPGELEKARRFNDACGVKRPGDED